MGEAAVARHRDDRGASTVGFAVVFASILVLLMLAVQAGLYWHVRQRADAAAARVDGSAAAGHAAAEAFLAGAPLNGASVSVSRGSTEAVATVSGTAPTLVPIVDWVVYAEATVPLERFVPEDERFRCLKDCRARTQGCVAADVLVGVLGFTNRPLVVRWPGRARVSGCAPAWPGRPSSRR